MAALGLKDRAMVVTRVCLISSTLFHSPNWNVAISGGLLRPFDRAFTFYQECFHG
jgi:hypothetical protein